MSNGGLDREVLHQSFVSALDDRVAAHSEIDQRPLDIDLKHPLPSRVRVYIYTVTKAGGSRPEDEFNIQVFIPGVDRGESGSLDYSDNRFVVLAGYHADEDVFVLWDAYMHSEFSHSETVQVKLGTIKAAADEGLCTQVRHLNAGDETVIAVSSTRLKKGILRRIHLTNQSLPEGANPGDELEADIDAERAVDYSIPEERETTTTRILRNTGIVNQLKEDYDYQCQICGEQRMRGKKAYYAEGHHLKPLSEGGPDDIANIIILCPNHHADFDYGQIKIDPESLDITHAYEDDRGMSLTVLPGHEIDESFIRYNNESVADF